MAGRSYYSVRFFDGVVVVDKRFLLREDGLLF